MFGDRLVDLRRVLKSDETPAVGNREERNERT